MFAKIFSLFNPRKESFNTEFIMVIYAYHQGWFKFLFLKDADKNYILPQFKQNDDMDLSQLLKDKLSEANFNFEIINNLTSVPYESQILKPVLVKINGQNKDLNINNDTYTWLTYNQVLNKMNNNQLYKSIITQANNKLKKSQIG